MYYFVKAKILLVSNFDRSHVTGQQFIKRPKKPSRDDTIDCFLHRYNPPTCPKIQQTAVFLYLPIRVTSLEKLSLAEFSGE